MVEVNGEIETVAIIPAFNEVGTISGVVRGALTAELVDACIVVDDGSRDGTHNVVDSLAKSFEDMEAVHHSANQGKSEALFTGVDIAKKLAGPALRTLVFLDGDISPISSREYENARLGHGLTQRVTKPADKNLERDFVETLAGHIDGLIRPVASGDSVMSIGMLQRNAFIDALRLGLNWGVLCGNRAVSIELWDSMIKFCETKDIQITGWQVEAALNSYTRLNKSEDGVKLNSRISKILMKDVVNIGSRVKAGGLIRGIGRMARVHTSATWALAKFSTQF